MSHTFQTLPSRVIVLGSSGPVAPAASRVQAIVLRQMPRLSDQVEVLRRRIAAWNVAALDATLRTHLVAVGAIRFELLVSPGLRAAPSERDETAFRRQVEAVSECTEATWNAVRRFLDDGLGEATQVQELVTDFTMEFRSLLRRCTEAAGPVDARGADAAVQAKLDALAGAGRSAQSAAYELAESHAMLRGTLKRLALRLGGGLLERLRVLVAGDMASPADELRAAQQARSDLQGALSHALFELSQLLAGSQDLVVWLEAVTYRGQACAEA